jgi:leucyl-tRNA synthetase
MDYGTGAIFACPAHDQRDLDFARKYDLPVLPVVLPPARTPRPSRSARRPMSAPAIFNSEFLDGLDIEAAKVRGREPHRGRPGPGRDRLSPARLGRLAPALLGLPDPGDPLRGLRPVVPVPEDQLPVVLPDDVTFDKPGNPLLRHPTWRHTTCPSCGGKAERETDTLDTFVDSELVLRPLHRHRPPPSRSARRRPTTGWPSTSISAASSTRSCTCCTPASSPAR